MVFARILASGCKVMILNHPTRGVDIGAKEEIYSLIRDMTSRGIAVILLGVCSGKQVLPGSLQDEQSTDAFVKRAV